MFQNGEKYIAGEVQFYFCFITMSSRSDILFELDKEGRNFGARSENAEF